MKHFIYLIMVTLVLSSSATIARGQAFEEGNLVFSAGYGFPNLGKAFFNLYKEEVGFEVNGIGPLHGKVEYAIADNIGVGLSINYVAYDVTWHDETDNYIYSWDVNGFSVLARFNFHFGDSDKVDPYVGVGAGYRLTKYEFFTDDPFWVEDNFNTFSLPTGFEATLGLRYYIVPMVGIYGEIGLAKSLIQGGIAVKI